MTELTTHDSPKVRLFVVPRLTRSIAPLRSATAGAATTILNAEKSARFETVLHFFPYFI